MQSFVFDSLVSAAGVCLLHRLQRQLLFSMWTFVSIWQGKTIADLKPHGCCETFAFQSCFGHFVCFMRVLLYVITQCEATLWPGCSGSVIKGPTDGAHEFLRYCRTNIIINLGAILLFHGAVALGSNFSNTGKITSVCCLFFFVFQVSAAWNFP